MRMLGTVVIFFFACLLPFKVAFFLISPHVDQEFVFYILFRRVKNKERAQLFYRFIMQVLTLWVVISPYEIHEHINMEVSPSFL